MLVGWDKCESMGGGATIYIYMTVRYRCLIDRYIYLLTRTRSICSLARYISICSRSLAVPLYIYIVARHLSASYIFDRSLHIYLYICSLALYL